MSRFGHSNSAEKLMLELDLTGNKSSGPDGSLMKSVDDFEMGTGAKPQITGSHSSVSNGLETTLVDSLETTLNEIFASTPFILDENRIYVDRAPLKLEESSLFKPLFQPKTIAVGPHHRNLSNVTVLENHKLSALRALCGVDSIREKLFGVDKIVPLRDILTIIEGMEEDARRCYKRNVGLSRKDFVQVLLVDSVFILTVLILEPRGGVSMFDDQEWVWETEDLLGDLILMENQIPFFILERMWSAIKENIAIDDDVKELDVIGLFKRTDFCKKLELREDVDLHSNKEYGCIENLLGLYYCWYVPVDDRESTCDIHEWPHSWFGSSQHEGRKIPSAIDLYNAGLIFEEKDKSDCTNIFDITFANGVLQIPTLEIDSINMSLITNLLCHENDNRYKLAYEQGIVASYVYVMDSLINTKADIAFLQKFGIVNNKLATDDEAVVFINSLNGQCLEGKYNNFYNSVIKDVQVFTKPCWRRNWTSFTHNYFTSPWTGISLIAGNFLLFLTCAQTYYTIFPRK